MAKKARRKKQTVLTEAQLAGTRREGATDSGKVAFHVQATEKRARQTVDFRTEYHYVITDLRRIGILAAVMFVVLIGLNLVLQ